MNHALLPKVRSASLPSKYEAAKVALAECSRVDECKEWADKAQALASYARQSQDKEMEKTAMRIRARAIRRCGELLTQIKAKHTGRIRGGESPNSETRKQAANNAGLSSDQAKDAIRVSRVNGHSFEEQVESDDPPTVKHLADQGKSKSKVTPIYERLGMTKKAFQAGMHFRGNLERYAKDVVKFSVQDVVDGSLKEDREEIKILIDVVTKQHEILLKKL